MPVSHREECSSQDLSRRIVLAPTSVNVSGKIDRRSRMKRSSI